MFRRQIQIFKFFRVVSILTVFVNKTLLSDISLNAPMFIALYQTFITAGICFIKKALSRIWPENFDFPETNVWEIKNIKAVSFYIIQ